MTSGAAEITKIMRAVVNAGDDAARAVAFTGKGEVPSAFAVTDFAAAAVASAALAIRDLIQTISGKQPEVKVDRRLASLWFDSSLRPCGWKVPDPWDSMSGNYRCLDGWIRLHTNVPRHRLAAEQILGSGGNPLRLRKEIAGWGKQDLETAIVEIGGCAAAMLSQEQWATHAQGAAVAKEPLIWLDTAGDRAPLVRPVRRERPLERIRILDLTRVVAGPVATRFLAGFGADTLRVDPLDWDEPGLVPDVQLGKRSIRLDLHAERDRSKFIQLLEGADVLVHSYRPGALGRLGFGSTERRRLAPGLIDVSLNAYGLTGPWRERRGFDTIVQMSAGIADAGMRTAGTEEPVLLPFQALDHAVGYLMAGIVVQGINMRVQQGVGMRARASLARVAKLLGMFPTSDSGGIAPERPDDIAAAIETTPWGPARRLVPPVEIEGTPLEWPRRATPLGQDRPVWLP